MQQWQGPFPRLSAGATQQLFQRNIAAVAEDLGFHSQSGQIGHSVANG